MSQEGISRKSKKVKSTKYIPAGKLSTLANKITSSLSTKSPVQHTGSNEACHLKLIEEQQHLGVGFQREAITHRVAPVVQKQVQQVPLNSTTLVTPTVQEQVQQVPQDSTAPMIQVQEEVHQRPHNSTTSAENEQSEERGPSTQKRKRGRTMMQNLHGRNERKVIVLNELDQPVGPTEADVKEYSSFLGTLARTATLCPLNIFDWRKMNTTDDLWKYTKEKYDIPEEVKTWTLESISNAWRRYKSRLKKDHYKAYENDELRMENKPEGVPESQFKDLLKYWNSEEAQKTSETNIRNRKKSKNHHTAGKTSFAVIRTGLEKEKGSPDAVTPKDIFVTTRSRKPGRTYKESDEDTINKIAEMEKIQSQQSDDDSESVDPFTSVMGPEHPGRVRLYGRRVTKTILKEKRGHSGSSLHDATEIMDKKMEEIEERMRQRMEKKFEEQKATLQQEFTIDFITKLKRLAPEFQLNPKMLAALLSPLGEATSAQAAGQPIHPLSTGSNNQGEGNAQAEDERSDGEDLEDLT